MTCPDSASDVDLIVKIGRSKSIFLDRQTQKVLAGSARHEVVSNDIVFVIT